MFLVGSLSRQTIVRRVDLHDRVSFADRLQLHKAERLETSFVPRGNPEEESALPRGNLGVTPWISRRYPGVCFYLWVAGWTDLRLPYNELERRFFNISPWIACRANERSLEVEKDSW